MVSWTSERTNLWPAVQTKQLRCKMTFYYTEMKWHFYNLPNTLDLSQSSLFLKMWLFTFLSALYSLHLFQHPCVHDEVSGVSLVGLPALQALLYHCQYFQNVAFSASICYRGRYTFHLHPRAGGTGGPSLQESTSGGKLWFIIAVFMLDLCFMLLQSYFFSYCVYMSLDSENSLWFWRCDPPPPATDSNRPSSSLSTSSTMVGLYILTSIIFLNLVFFLFCGAET